VLSKAVRTREQGWFTDPWMNYIPQRKKRVTLLRQKVNTMNYI